VFSKRNEDQEWSRSRSTQPAERADAEAAEAAPTPGGITVQAPQSGLGQTSRTIPGDVNVTVPARAPRSSTSLDGHEIESLIGERTSFEGTFKSEGAVRVLGTVQGEIESKGAIFIEERAHVTAKVVAGQVAVAGRVDGQIFCQGRVEIRPTGRVTGEIHAGALIVQEGAYFEGSSKMTAATPPATGTSSGAGSSGLSR
jgi:cytoskeletal protein CcmA (bactofilin family)